jgi:hypothetical protein
MNFGRSFLRTTELAFLPRLAPLFAPFALNHQKLLHVTHFHITIHAPNLPRKSIQDRNQIIMARLSMLFVFLSTFFLTATAQFGFFDQMFGGGGGHQHQEPQNVRSDSSWYQAQYEAGMLLALLAPLGFYPVFAR